MFCLLLVVDEDFRFQCYSYCTYLIIVARVFAVFFFSPLPTHNFNSKNSMHRKEETKLSIKNEMHRKEETKLSIKNESNSDLFTKPDGSLLWSIA